MWQADLGHSFHAGNDTQRFHTQADNGCNSVQVVWLDVAAARARFGEWIEGALPSFLKHPARGKLSARARRKGPKDRDTGEDGGVEPEGVVRDATGQLLSVRMQQLRYRWSVACAGNMLQGHSACAETPSRQPQLDAVCRAEHKPETSQQGTTQSAQ